MKKFFVTILLVVMVSLSSLKVGAKTCPTHPANHTATSPTTSTVATDDSGTVEVAAAVATAAVVAAAVAFAKKRSHS